MKRRINKKLKRKKNVPEFEKCRPSKLESSEKHINSTNVVHSLGWVEKVKTIGHKRLFAFGRY